MTRLFRHTPTRLREATGARLRARREDLGMKRSTLAASVGYQNLSKGSQRIAEWERGTFNPLLDNTAFLAALGLRPDALDAALALADLVETRIAHLVFDVVAAERELFCTHAALLRTHARRLTKDRFLGAVCSPAVTLRLLWMGGGSLSLGTLVGAWAAGALVADTTNHGTVWLFEGAGSALSGAGRCAGVDESGTLRHIDLSPTRFFSTGFVPRWTAPATESPLCLADVLASLGAEVPAIRFFELSELGLPEPKPMAVYHPTTRCFETAGGRSTRIGPSGGDQTNADLRLVQGAIEGPRGWLPVQVMGPCPPVAVLPHLHRCLQGRRAWGGHA